MLIHCTKKLLDQMGTQPDPHGEEDPLFSWNANVLTLNRKKAVVLVNDKNRYAIVLYGLKAKDFKRLDQLILEGIRETFRQEGMKEQVIAKYLLHSGKISFTKTKDRTSVARMNNICGYVPFFEEVIDHCSIYQPGLSKKLSSLLVGDGKKSYFYPNQVMYKDLEEFAGEPIFRGEAAILKVNLVLKGHQVWRRIAVPVHMSFCMLHQTLQAAFGWSDEHLHEFFIYNDSKVADQLNSNHPAYHKEGFEPILHLVCHEGALEYEGHIEMVLEKDMRLPEMITEYKHMKYHYDFGDGWQHYIKVEKMIDDYKYNHPVCLEGSGNTPPENVGGEDGFNEFLAVLADPAHPQHQEMSAWGREHYKEFDINQVNRGLKDV